TMTFSEFGRRIRSNESFGTDHGDAAPLMLFGSCVAPGFVGNNPEIPDEPEVQEALPMQYDFRNVYGSVLQDWFQIPEETVRQILYAGYQHIPIIQGCETVNSTGEAAAPIEITAAPNPFINQVRVSFACGNERVRLSVYNSIGHEMAVAFDKTLPAGEHQATIEASDWPAGHYYLHLQLEKGRQRTKLLVKSR
ncbi:MAG: DUF1501 domain-containing protein, partial [Bacteroidetes bacterium]